MLTLVVDRAPGEEASVPDARLERRRFPKLERFRWLDIIMTVDQEMWVSAATRASQNDGISLRAIYFGFQSDATAVCPEPFRTRQEIRLVLRLGRHTGKTQVVA